VTDQVLASALLAAAPGSLLPPAELRKDKADRAPGGVTPGDDPAYFAAVARAAANNSNNINNAAGAGGRDRSPMRGGAGVQLAAVQQQQLQRPRTPVRGASEVCVWGHPTNWAASAIGCEPECPDYR
jgi:hypothetical protein